MRRASIVLALLAGCTAAPAPIAEGEPCARCHMLVADVRFGARIVTATGASKAYDSIECVAQDVFDHPDPAATVFVVPFDEPGTLVRADRAVFVQSAVRSPMAMNIVAYRPDSPALTGVEGERLDWRDVLDLVHSQRPERYGHAH